MDRTAGEGAVERAGTQIGKLCQLIYPLIRELTEYRDFINLKIKEQPE
jgi:hypothetical protein